LPRQLEADCGLAVFDRPGFGSASRASLPACSSWACCSGVGRGKRLLKPAVQAVTLIVPNHEATGLIWPPSGSNEISDESRHAARLPTHRPERCRRLVSQSPSSTSDFRSRFAVASEQLSSRFAEDVLQDTFVEVFRDIHKFEARQSGTFPSWLMTVAQHQVLCTLDRLGAQKRGGKRRHIRPASRHASSIVDLVEQLSDSRDRPSGQAARREAVLVVQVGLKLVELKVVDSISNDCMRKTLKTCPLRGIHG
jgi:DNA-directed RNA polymerase specialized sigma24 family protein